MEELTPEGIREGLVTKFVGQKVVCFESIGSTNEVAKGLVDKGAPEGTLVIAEEQTAGKGRLGRRWIALAGTGLLFSLLLYPDLTLEQIPRLTMLASLAAAEAIESVAGLPVRFKWPNDIMIRGRKAGGVLTEVGVTGERLDYVVVGIGLNVNWNPSQVPELAGKATGLSEELGREVSRLELLQRVLLSMEREYLRLQEGYLPHEVFTSRLANMDQKVEVVLPRGKEEGFVDGVDGEGALLLRRDDGTTVRVTMGEVA
ncbi:MAG: biotin--[acetyl-CoA-carboxylase] ligase [Anaerolineae bacterium]